MDNIESLPLSALSESPFNPRKNYPESDLQELADSITSQGVMQPIVVRIQPEELNADMHYEYEIVFGHRRARAAALAGLERVPCIVRVMTDEQAAIAQVHENMKRSDVTALEEADSYQHLRETHGMAGDKICEVVGKTRSYVYARLKLAEAASEVRQAVATQGLSPEIAQKIARLAKHELQRHALSAVRDKYKQTAEQPLVWMSVREATYALKRMFDIDLDDAPFDLADAKLAKIAGACTTCPRRAGNCEGLEDVLAASICTDSACYDMKVKEHTRLELARLAKAGHRVIEGQEARDYMPSKWQTPRGFSRVEQIVGHTGEGSERTAVTLEAGLAKMGADAPLTTVIVDPDGRVLHFLTDEAAEHVAKALGFVDDEDEGDSSTPSTAGARTSMGGTVGYESPAHRAVALHWTTVAQACIGAAAGRSERTTFELRMVARALMQERDELPAEVAKAMGWQAEIDAESGEEETGADETWTYARLESCSANELARFAVLMALTGAPAQWGEGSLAEKLAIAEHFGINPEDPATGSIETDEPADAGLTRDPNTSDMFEGAQT